MFDHRHPVFVGFDGRYAIILRVPIGFGFLEAVLELTLALLPAFEKGIRLFRLRMFDGSALAAYLQLSPRVSRSKSLPYLSC